MTSQQRHLKDLLKEDQEPFHHLILKNQHPRNLQLNRKKTVKQNASFPAHFCKNACFFSKFQVDSPDYLRSSPLLSPAFGAKSPTRAAFLHVPAKTAALLLEAACRVQKNSSASAQKKIKPKTHIRNSGFGLFGSVIKRLTNRARTRKIETGVSIQPADDVIRWADSVKRSSVSRRDEIRVGSPDISVLVEDQTGFSNARLSSVWSEENKSLTSSSSSSTCCSTSASGNISEEEREEKIGFVNPLDKDIGRNLDDDFTFCLSPLSPFRFALQKSPSTGRRSPAFCSPAGSPSRRKFQEHGSYEDQDPSVEEEEKEQCSPVSILDPPFGDDGEEEEEEETQAEDEDEFDMECSYAFVQRAKQHLLQKLRNFEKLAKLDPVELERRMAEEEEETDDDLPTSVVDVQGDIECYLVDIAVKSGIVEDLMKPGMKRLLQDLISEEEKTESSGANYESLMKRLESWKEVEAKTIEMMVAMDLKGENSTWKKPREEEITETAKMVEFSILGALLEELLEEVTMC